MKKSIYMLLPALCLLASCTNNTGSSSNPSNASSSTHANIPSSSEVAPSSSAVPSSSSSVPVTVIEPSEVNDVADIIHATNSSDRFAAPAKMWMTSVPIWRPCTGKSWCLR